MTSVVQGNNTNRLAVPLVKLATVANQPGFASCQPTDLKRPARQCDFSRNVTHPPSATQSSPLR